MRMGIFHFMNGTLQKLNEDSWGIKTNEGKLSFLRSKVELCLCGHTQRPIVRLKTDAGSVCLHNDDRSDDTADYEAMKNYLISLL